MGLCDFLSFTDKAVWAALAAVIVVVIVVTAASLVPYVLAIQRRVNAEWELSLRPPMIRWKVSANEQVEDGGSLNEATVVKDEHNGELTVPIDEHSAVR